MKPRSFTVELTKADYVVGLSALIGELSRLNTGRQRMLFARLAIAIGTWIIIAYAFPHSMVALFGFFA